jgi:signal transduction histidine kinase
LLIAAILYAAWLLYKLRAGILIRQNDRLQIKVNERTFELEQSILIRERLISVIMHDLRSPLYSQDLLIGYLYEHDKELPAADLKELLLQLRDSSKRICQFSTDFLAWYNSQQQGFLLERRPVELAACIKDASFFYREIAERQGLAFGYDVTPGLFLLSDRNILTIIIRNLVDNAVKYTRSGSIHIIAFAKDTDLYIKVNDTGRGISAEKIEQLMAYPESNANNTNSTFGYRFIMELTRQLGGAVHIESEPQVGTVVTLAFKV